MILRRLLFSAIRYAARNPEVRRQGSKLADRAVEKARPGLMKASRKAGQFTQIASDELSEGVKKFKVESRRRPKK
jgi:hypothetical protein